MPGPATITCLVADDNALMRHAVSACLAADPSIELIDTADDGDHLLELVDRHRPRVVIADAHMPRLDGVAACRAITERHPQTAVILYTGLDEVDLLEAALDAGARGFLVKSGSTAALVRSLRLVADGGTYADAELMSGLVKRRAAQRGTPLTGRELEAVGRIAEGLAIGPELAACASSAMGKLDDDTARRLAATLT